jgi:hypothetical protein
MAILVITLFPRAGFACSCLDPGIRGRFKQADIVFAGKAVSIDDSKGFPEVHFDVDRSWKGVGANTVSVLTARDGASCGAEFDVGKDYLIYARLKGTAFVTGLCDGTHAVAEGDSEVIYLTWFHGPLPYWIIALVFALLIAVGALGRRVLSRTVRA